MKKKFLILFVVLFLTGCSATYDVIVEENNISESLKISNYDSSSWNYKIGNITYEEMIDSIYNSPIPVLYYTPGIFENDFELNGYDYYSKKIVSTSDNYGISLNFRFNFNDYKNSTIINNTVKKIDITKDNNKTIINAYINNNIFENYNLLDKITINVTIPYNVTYNNADSISNNVYTWFIEKNNANTKSISVTYITKEEELIINDKEEEKEKMPFKLILMIILLVLLVGFMISLIFVYKFKKNNDV